MWSNKNDFYTLRYFQFCLACVFLDSQGFPGFLGFPPHVYLLAPNTSTTGTSGTSSTSFVVVEQEWYKDKVAPLSQFCWGEGRGRAQWWGKPFPLAIHFLFITLHTSVWNLRVFLLGSIMMLSFCDAQKPTEIKVQLNIQHNGVLLNWKHLHFMD